MDYHIQWPREFHSCVVCQGTILYLLNGVNFTVVHTLLYRFSIPNQNVYREKNCPFLKILFEKKMIIIENSKEI